MILTLMIILTENSSAVPPKPRTAVSRLMTCTSKTSNNVSFWKSEFDEEMLEREFDDLD